MFCSFITDGDWVRALSVVSVYVKSVMNVEVDEIEEKEEDLLTYFDWFCRCIREYVLLLHHRYYCVGGLVLWVSVIDEKVVNRRVLRVDRQTWLVPNASPRCFAPSEPILLYRRLSVVSVCDGWESRDSKSDEFCSTYITDSDCSHEL